MMKKLTLILLSLLLTGTSALALTGIANTPHNFTWDAPLELNTDVYLSEFEDEYCVFCHTPHGGSLDAPLWNRDTTSISGAGHYTHYSSTTLSSYLTGVSGRAVNGPSLACLSCHDGSIGIGDNLLNTSPDVPDNAAAVIVGIGDAPVARIGAVRGDISQTTDLSDDHPISFSYASVKAEKSSDFQLATYVETQGITLPNGNVECTSCHDPHVDYITDTTLDPFLRISNDKSAMCLSCHIK